MGCLLLCWAVCFSLCKGLGAIWYRDLTVYLWWFNGVPTRLAMLAPLPLVCRLTLLFGAVLDRRTCADFYWQWVLWRVLVEAETQIISSVCHSILFGVHDSSRRNHVCIFTGAAMSVFAIVDRKWLRIPTRAGLFLVPFGLYQWWRYDYFGWAYPNTYYAKSGLGNRFKPFDGTYADGNTFSNISLNTMSLWKASLLLLGGERMTTFGLVLATSYTERIGFRRGFMTVVGHRLHLGS